TTTQCICMAPHKIMLSTVFAGQNVGMKQVGDRIWLGRASGRSRPVDDLTRAARSNPSYSSWVSHPLQQLPSACFGVEGGQIAVSVLTPRRVAHSGDSQHFSRFVASRTPAADRPHTNPVAGLKIITRSHSPS